jgi:hypothetical protein
MVDLAARPVVFKGSVAQHLMKVPLRTHAGRKKSAF